MRTKAVIAAGLLVAGCGGNEAFPSTTTTAPVVESTASSVNYPATIETVPDERAVYSGFSNESSLPSSMTLVARAYADVVVHEKRGGAGTITTIPATTILGTPTVFAVLKGPVDGWAKVMLPMRPNGTTGWIDTDGMSLYVVDGRVVVDISDRTLTYYEGDEVVLETSIAVGTDRNPTPTGTFYVTDNVTMADPNSPWGPHAFGLSARSETITEYNGGDGIIGIHGTNRPTSIGNAASLGCIRLPNEAITTLHSVIPIGTPVDITA